MHLNHEDSKSEKFQFHGSCHSTTEL